MGRLRNKSIQQYRMVGSPRESASGSLRSSRNLCELRFCCVTLAVYLCVPVVCCLRPCVSIIVCLSVVCWFHVVRCPSRSLYPDLQKFLSNLLKRVFPHGFHCHQVAHPFVDGVLDKRGYQIVADLQQLGEHVKEKRLPVALA